MTNESVGQVLRAARLERGWPQEQLALRAGVPVRTLSRLERGLIRPAPVTTDRIARVLGIDLVRDDEQTTPTKARRRVAAASAVLAGLVADAAAGGLGAAALDYGVVWLVGFAFVCVWLIRREVRLYERQLGASDRLRGER